jgi:hypothetical protein
MYDLEKITMTVKVERPPIWDEIHKHFKINDEMTVYTYENILYNPANGNIDIFLMEHEKACAAQQLSYEGGAKAWWNRYFIDKQFMADAEFEAYWYQYRLFCQHFASIDKRFKYRWLLADGFLRNASDCGMTKTEICNLLKTNIHK